MTTPEKTDTSLNQAPRPCVTTTGANLADVMLWHAFSKMELVVGVRFQEGG